MKAPKCVSFAKHRFAILRDRRLYDSTDDLEQAIQFARSLQRDHNGIWQVSDRDTGQDHYMVGPTTFTLAPHPARKLFA